MHTSVEGSCRVFSLSQAGSAMSSCSNWQGLLRAHYLHQQNCLWPCLLPDGWTLPIFIIFLSDPGVPGVRSVCPDVCASVTHTPFADLTDVTLADEDSNSIPTDDDNKAVLSNVAMQVAPSGGQH